MTQVRDPPVRILRESRSAPPRRTPSRRHSLTFSQRVRGHHAAAARNQIHKPFESCLHRIEIGVNIRMIELTCVRIAESGK